MIDIHSHVLPQVDDGSQNLEDSLEMIRMSADSGVKILAVTPHVNQRGRFENYQNQIADRYLDLRRAVRAAGIDIHLAFGMEIYSSYDLPELIEKKMIRGLNGSRYFLIEFPFEADLGYIYRCLHLIFDAGGIPVLAHPERYKEIQRSPGILYHWIQEGVCIQINKDSIFGYFGPAAKKTVEYIFEYDLATCVGSDAHGIKKRTTDMKRFRKYLVRHYGEDYAKKITRDNPYRILQNKRVPLHGVREDLIK